MWRVMTCKAAGVCSKAPAGALWLARQRDYIFLLGQGLRASVSGRRARRRAFFFFKAAPGKARGGGVLY